MYSFHVYVAFFNIERCLAITIEAYGRGVKRNNYKAQDTGLVNKQTTT